MAFGRAHRRWRRRLTRPDGRRNRPEYLYPDTEFPAIHHKTRLADAMRAARPGESTDQAWERLMGEGRALQLSPFFPLWASAAIDGTLSALHERLLPGSLASRAPKETRIC